MLLYKAGRGLEVDQLPEPEISSRHPHQDTGGCGIELYACLSAMHPGVQYFLVRHRL